MFRKATLVAFGLGLGLTATLAAFAAGPFFAPEPPTTAGEPFSAVAQTQSTTDFADGNRIVRTNTVHYYRDGQGRVRVERPPPDEAAPFALMGLGMGIGANGMTTESSAETTSLGQQIVNGVTATGTRVVRVIPVGVLGNEKPITSTVEEWKSAELGIPVRITAKSSVGGSLTYNLQELQRAEPDASLFTVPDGYKLMNLPGPGAGLSTFTAVKKP